MNLAVNLKFSCECAGLELWKRLKSPVPLECSLTIITHHNRGLNLRTGNLKGKVYTCMYLYMYVRTKVCTHVSMHVCWYVCMHARE